MKEVPSLFGGSWNVLSLLLLLLNTLVFKVESLHLENVFFLFFNIGLVTAAGHPSFQQKHGLINNRFSWTLVIFLALRSR